LSKKFRGKELPRLAIWRRQFSLKTDAISWMGREFLKVLRELERLNTEALHFRILNWLAE
jgi:hypothetical protein